MPSFLRKFIFCFGALLSKCSALVADDLQKLYFYISDPVISIQIHRILLNV